MVESIAVGGGGVIGVGGVLISALSALSPNLLRHDDAPRDSQYSQGLSGEAKWHFH